jgi:hypothetical protein
MSWVVLAIALGFWLLARTERAMVMKVRDEIVVAKAALEVEVERAEALRRAPTSSARCVILPAPFPLAARATTDCQGACALYSWLAIRGEGRA